MLLLLFLAVSRLQGQELFSSAVEKSVTTQQGLPGNFIQNMVPDHLGRVWIATSNGLAVMSGSGITMYRATGSASTLWSNGIARIGFSTWRKQLVISYYDGAIQFLDVVRGNFSAVIPGTIGAIHSIIEDKKGDILLVSQTGLALLSPVTLHIQPIALPVSGMRLNTAITSALRRCFIVGTEEHGLWEIRLAASSSAPAVMTLQRLPLGDSTTSYPLREIQTLAEDRTTLWIGTRRNGLVRTTLPPSVAIEHSSEPWRFTIVLPQERISACAIDSMGNVWVGIPAKGLMRFNGVGIQRYVSRLAVPALTIPTGMMCSPDGTMWIGSNGNGMFLFATQSHHRTTPMFGKNLFARDSVFALAPDIRSSDQGYRLWVGTKRGATRYAVHFPSLQSDTTTGQRSIENVSITKEKVIETGKSVTAILSLRSSEWLGIYGGGLLMATEKGLLPVEQMRQALITAMLRTSSDSAMIDTIIVATSNMGVWRIIHTSAHTVSAERVGDSTIHGYALARYAGGILLGTKNRGVIDVATGQTLFSALARHNVYALCRTGDSLFIGTESGLYLALLDSRQARLLSATEHIAIVSLVWSKDATLLCGTDKGILAYSTVNERRILIPLSDPVHTFSLGAGLAMYPHAIFGTVGGDVILQPSAIVYETSKAVPRIIAVRAMSSSAQDTVQWSAEQGIIQSVVVPSDISAVALDLTTAEFTRLTAVRYRYRIMTHPTVESSATIRWIETGSASQIVIARTDDTDISIEIQAMNDDGTWSDVGTHCHIMFLAPWWASWKLWLVVVVCFSAFLYALYRARIGRLQRRSRELEAIVAERTEELQRINARFAEMIDELEWKQDELNTRAKELERLNLEKNEILGIAAHDLKNPLRAISMSVNLIERKSVSLDEATAKRLRNIGSSAARMSSIIEKLLTLNAVETGRYDLTPSVFDAVTSLSNLLEPYFTVAEAKDIMLDFSSDIQRVLINGNETAFLTVVDNLVSNAIKYSPQSMAVNVRLTHTSTDNQPSVFIAVQDHGPGFSDTDKQQMFQKFARLSAQPTGDEDSTGLGLSIVKTLVEAMHGRVWCESEAGKGALFVVEFPCLPDTHEEFIPPLSETSLE